MNGHQRISAALNGIMPDKRPIMLHNFLSAAEQFGISMKQYRENPRSAADCLIESVERYGLDGVMFDVDEENAIRLLEYCTKVTKQMIRLMSTTGVDLGLDAVELDYKTSIDKIHDTMHDKCTLFGTIDPSGVITYGSINEVERETLELLKVYKGCPRPVVNAGCAIPKEAPRENIKRFADTVHNMV